MKSNEPVCKMENAPAVSFTLALDTEERVKQQLILDDGPVQWSATPLWSFRSARMWLALSMSVMVCAISASRTTLATAVICMLNHTKLANDAVNDTHGACASIEHDDSQAYNGDINYSSDQVALLFSVVFYGSMLTGLPGGYLCDRFGPRVFSIGLIMVVTVSTALFPLAVTNVGFGAAAVLRFGVGLGYGLMLPCILSMTSKWFAKSERVTVLTIWTTGNQLGTMLAYPTGSFFCSMTDVMGGWPLIFYSAACLGFISLIMLVAFAVNSPDRHFWITTTERNYINQENGEQQFGSRKIAQARVPWRAIATSMPVIVTMISSYTSTMFLMTLSFYLPSYYNTVLGLDIKANGWLSMVPWLAMWLVKVGATTTVNVLISKGMFTSSMLSPMWLSGGFMLWAMMYDCTSSATAIILMTLSTASLGMIVPGHMVALTSIAPAYTGLLSSIGRVSTGLGGSFGAWIIGRVVVNGTREEYQIAFSIIIAQMALSGVLYVIFGTTEIQQWAVPPKHSSAATMKHSKQLAALRAAHA